MPGFRTVGAFAAAVDNLGQQWISTFRKVPPATATIAGQWFDYSTAAGNPVPNYYAAPPLEAALLDGNRGIFVPSVSPAKQFVHRLTLLSSAIATSANQGLFLLDYLLYYPFVDLDAAGEEQVMTNGVGLTRYQTGAGVHMMIVAQAPTIGGGSFTITYCNQDGVEGKITPTIFCAAAQPSGALVNATGNAGGVSPFVPLAAGDTGVRYVQSMTMIGANGGLGAIVLVKPLQTDYILEAVTATAGAASERESVRQRPPAQIQDGAFLSFIGRGAGGTLASSPLVGLLETAWN